MGILDGDADQKDVPAEGGPDDEDKAALAFVLPHLEGLTPGAVGVVGREEGGCGMGVVSDDAAVPLDAAGEPGVPQSEVGGLEDVVAEEQFPPFVLRIEPPEPSAEVHREFGPEEFVFQHGHAEGRGFQVPVVPVQHGIGEHGMDAPLTDPRALLRGHPGIDPRVRRIGTGQSPDVRDGVRRAEIGAFHGNILVSKHR